VGVVTAGRLIPVRLGDIEIEVDAVPVAGTEATSGRAARAAGNALEAFGRAQDAIIEVANLEIVLALRPGGSLPAGTRRNLRC
jgi:hypothetical protein